MVAINISSMIVSRVVMAGKKGERERAAKTRQFASDLEDGEKTHQ